jgi:ubiquinone/menaquinone biosynthesis C-methylase UbiE
LQREHPEVEVHGADVDSQAIEWCQKNLQPARFLATLSEPPLPYTDQFFDLIYCVSVFTHLNERSQDLWLAELTRLLSREGALVLTVHGELAARVLDPNSQSTLRTTGFVHRRSAKLKGIQPDWYHTTWHSRDYIVNRLAARFQDVRYEVLAGSVQDIVIASRPARTGFEAHSGESAMASLRRSD